MAESNKPKITVRKAQVGDHQAVLDINRNIYYGLDYIPHYYEELVTDPDFSFYVCEVDGEVGAFEGVCLLDDNASLMTRAARVKPKFEGQGLLQHVRKKIYEDYKDLPGEKKIRSCCTNLVRLVNSQTFRAQNVTLAEKELLSFEPVQTDLKFPPPYDLSIPDTSELTLEELGLFFKDKAVCDYLFPEGFLSIISWFFNPVHSNLKHIKKLTPYISVSDSLLEKVKNSETASFTDQNNPEKGSNPSHGDFQGLLAISSNYTAPGNLLYVIDIFGRPRPGKEEQDIRHLIYHSVKKAAELHESHNPRLALYISLSVGNDHYSEMYKEALRSLGLIEGEVTDMFRKHYYFEQNLECLLGS